MTGLDDIVIQIAVALLLLYGYAVAMRDWGAGVADELEAGLHLALRRRALHWAAAAGTLFALLVMLQWYVGGATLAAAYLSGSGSFILLQIGALLVLLPVGSAWAMRLGRAPLGGDLPWGWTDTHGELKLRRLRMQHSDLLWIGLGLPAMLLWTIALARLFPGYTTATLPDRFVNNVNSSALAWPLVMALLTLAPIIEESFFRLYLMHRIAGACQGQRGAVGIGLVASAVAFGLAHFGQLHPFWLKFTESTGLGIVLGIVAWRRGLEAAIALHWLFNLSLIPLVHLLR